MVGEAVDVAGSIARLGSSALARPKSSTFTVPSGRSLIFAGLRSRWMIPCSCAASSASAICRAIGRASSSGSRSPGLIRVGQRRSLDQLQHERRHAVGFFKAVNRRDVRMIQRGEDLSLALEARQPIGIEREDRRGEPSVRRRDSSCRVARAIDLAHPARPEHGEDFVRPELSAGGKAHDHAE